MTFFNGIFALTLPSEGFALSAPWTAPPPVAFFLRHRLFPVDMSQVAGFLSFYVGLVSQELAEVFEGSGFWVRLAWSELISIFFPSFHSSLEFSSFTPPSFV